MQDKDYKKSFMLTRTCATVVLCLLCLCGTGLKAQQIPIVLLTTDLQVQTSKVYDGTTTCTVLSAVARNYDTSSTDFLDTVSVTLNITALYADQYVGNNKDLTFSWALGADDTAYQFVGIMGALPRASITPRQLDIVGFSTTNKVYDGTRTDSVAIGRLTGVLDVDTLDVNPRVDSALFDDANVGPDKIVRIYYGLWGNSASQYLAPPVKTSQASITPRPLQAWGATLVGSKVYDGSTNCGVTNKGTLILTNLVAGDSVVHDTAIAQYADPNVGLLKLVNVSHVLGGPQGSNYMVVDSSLYTASISQRLLQVSGAEVQLVKEYDGTTVATVTVPASTANFIPGDTLAMNTRAYYDDAEIGIDKTIKLHYDISQGQAQNYIAPADEVYSTHGKIISPTQLDATWGDNGIQVSAQSYCQNDGGTIRTIVLAGNPIRYNLTFDTEAIAQGFMNSSVGITAHAGDTVSIIFAIPTGCKEGHYTAYISFTNEAGVTTAPVACTITVGLQSGYLVKVFDDVVSIDNSGALDGQPNRFTTFQWYHNGAELSNATLPYYQDPSGTLNGTYYVLVNNSTVDQYMVCPATFTSSAATGKSIVVSPNPVADKTQVTLKGFAEGRHWLTVYNSRGQLVMRCAVDDNEYQVDLSTLSPDIYMFNIDGIIAKAIKY